VSETNQTPEPITPPVPVSKADTLFRELQPREVVQADVLFDAVTKALEGAQSGEDLDRNAVRRVSALLKQAGSGDPDEPLISVESALWAAVQKDAEGHAIGRTAPTAKVAAIAKRWKPEADPAKPAGQLGQ